MQCNALTRSGFRCNRKSEKLFCYQHITYLHFQNLLNLEEPNLILRLDGSSTLINLKCIPDPTIKIINTDLYTIPQFEGTSTLIADNLNIAEITEIQSLIRLSADNTLLSTIPLLQNLLYLNLNNTKHLITLPSFPILRNLYLNNSSITELPLLPQLKHLEISDTAISEILAPNLVSLKAQECVNLTEIKNLKLTTLNISKSKVVYLQHLRKIQILNATNCEDLITLPYSPIQILDISYSRKVLRIPNISTLFEVNAMGAFSLIKAPISNLQFNYAECPFLANSQYWENTPIQNLHKIIKIQRAFRVHLYRKFQAINFGYTDLKTVIYKYIY
jgi:hypothetical protein